MESNIVKPNKMKRMESKKSHSWWWNSHISPKNSKCLQENLEEMDQRVKQMLKLIEEDADSFSKKAEMYYQKRPELVSLVEDFYRRYRSLAERYDHVTGELRKNIPSDLQSQSSGISEVGSEPPSTMTSPDRKLSFRKSGHRAPGFEVFLGNAGGVGSDLYNKDGDESSTLDSESESDDSFGNNHSGNDEEQGLRRKIIELEDELREVKEKLQMREDEISEDSFRHNGDGDSQGHDKMAKYEEEIKCLKFELQKYKSLGESDCHDEPVVLDFGIDVLEAEDSLPKIQTLKQVLRITQEKLHESEEEVAGLREELTSKGLSVQNLQDQLKSAEEELSVWKNKLEKEISEKNKCMEELKKDLDALQMKYDTVVAEKDDLKTSISELTQDVSFKDDQIDQMSNHLHQLHMEHVDLIAGAEGARKLAEELHLRIKELEREVEKKQEIIVQGAEEKREAIRQLCFSLEHYRNGYHRLREVVTSQKPLMAT